MILWIPSVGLHKLLRATSSALQSVRASSTAQNGARRCIFLQSLYISHLLQSYTLSIMSKMSLFEEGKLGIVTMQLKTLLRMLCVTNILRFLSRMHRGKCGYFPRNPILWQRLRLPFVEPDSIQKCRQLRQVELLHRWLACHA